MENGDTTKPVGVTGAEYRKQWNRLNSHRMREASRRYRKNHPERASKFPREVREHYRKHKRKFYKPIYYRDWDKAENRNKPWTIEDQKLVETFNGTDRELSRIIGRSIQAIQKRRWLLRQSNNS